MLGLKVECRACASQVKFFSDKSETRSIPPYANLLRTYLVREALAVQGLDGMLWHSQVE